MLRIRSAQLEAFAPTAEAAFERDVLAHLRAEHADAEVRLPSGAVALSEIPDEQLLALVRGLTARARAYGMTWASSITSFVVLGFVVAPNFDDHPLIRRALADPEVAPNERLEAIWEQTTEENWQAAADAYDPARWETPTEQG